MVVLSVSDSFSQTSGTPADLVHGGGGGAAKHELAARDAEGCGGGEDAAEVAAGAADNHGREFRSLQVEVETEETDNDDASIEGLRRFIRTGCSPSGGFSTHILQDEEGCPHGNASKYRHQCTVWNP
ncbi:MAG: hypothetical protein US60_C0004G0003 [Microgenomates group bacterium GW2011_GWC1_37_8]|nr:MAG: hypothetical protein US60_C0004G0003 [Microgenomates group bacterium GW2011_GWC1_37_8]